MHKAGYLTHQRMKEPGSLYATHFIRFLIHCTLFILGKDEGKVITMAGKHKDPKKFQNPAPGQYEKEKADKVIYGSQQYSFGLRPEEKIKARAPAPNAYDPEKADTILEKQVKYTFGLKPEDMKKFNAPAPNAYNPEDMKKFNAPAPNA